MIEGWQIATAQLSELANGFIGVQVDGLGDGAALSTFGAHHSFGFRSRPRDPSANGAGCDVLYAYEGTQGHAWILGDARYAAAIPDEGAGGSVQYAVTASGKTSYMLMRGDTGAVTVRVEDAAGPIRLEHGATGTSVEVGQDDVILGGTPNAPVVVDVPSPLPGVIFGLSEWIAAVCTILSLPFPVALHASHVKAKYELGG